MNIVLIFADQMHKYALGKVRDYVKTPNLDRLCEEGVLFTNAYSNNPICGPFRGTLFSGMHSSHCGVVDNQDVLPRSIPCMADAFNNGGYNTSFVGKWHIGATGNKPIPEEIRGGFKNFIGYQCYNGFLNNVCFYDEENIEHVYNKHRIDAETDLAIERIKKLNSEGAPFLSVIAFQAPHYPVQPSEEFAALYKDTVFPYDEDYMEIDPYTKTMSPPSPSPAHLDPDYQKYGNNMQEYLRLYYAMVSQVDAGVGKIMSTIKELGIKEDTVVIFTADHGDMQGSHGRKNKCVSYEKSCGIPMIISAPNGKKNILSDTLISGIDLYPTILDIAGLPQEKQLEGKSVAPYLFGKEYTDHAVYSENYNGSYSWKMVRRGEYKLTIDTDNKPLLLFNMNEDPFEMTNLANNEEYKGIIDELVQMIRENL